MLIHASRRDKNNYIIGICADLERRPTENRALKLYDRVKYLAQEFKPKVQIVKDDLGNVITEAKARALHKGYFKSTHSQGQMIRFRRNSRQRL